jgi:branched-chain amino acid transport system substrate-binding protein
MDRIMTWRRAVLAMALAVTLAAGTAASAAEPIKLGFSVALTGGVAAIGKQVLIALQIWKDDVNAKGGLLGRPVDLVYYDDQSNPSNVPPIYTKLMEVDKVDLVIGPYATNLVVPAIPVLMAHDMATVGILANAANHGFHYKRYFSILNSGPEPEKAFSEGFFDLALQHKAELKTIALVGADAEFSQNAIAGARANLKNLPFTTVYDRNYPPQTTDFAPIIRAVQATNPDIVYVAAYPPDSVGIVRAANELGFRPKFFGGTFIGLIIAAVEVQLGPLMNGILNEEAFLPLPAYDFPGLKELLAKYATLAPQQGLDPLGYAFPPFGYAAAQVLAAGVEGSHSLDQDKIAEYIHTHTIPTVVGKIDFGPDGEWTKSHFVVIQFQSLVRNNLDDFRDTSHTVVLWPEPLKTGKLIFPYADAKK